jgi:hypothetical protein
MALSCGDTGGTHDLLVRNNTIVGFAYQGIQSDCISASSYTLNIQIIGNTIQSTPGNGIYIVRARQWTVRDNVIEDVGTNGIIVSDAWRIRLEGNRIRDTRSAGARTMLNGINILAQTNPQEIATVRIDSNTISNVLGNGINVVNATPGTITDVRILRNYVTDNDGWGIFVADVVDGDITQVVATQNYVMRNIAGTIRMDPSDGIIN